MRKGIIAYGTHKHFAHVPCFCWFHIDWKNFRKILEILKKFSCNFLVRWVK
jgi:hypothetical protein